jgi:hypothetical protein
VIANNVIFGNSTTRGIHMDNAGPCSMTRTLIEGNQIRNAEYAFVLQSYDATSLRNNVVSGIATDNVFNSGPPTNTTLMGTRGRSSRTLPRLHERAYCPARPRSARFRASRAAS